MCEADGCLINVFTLPKDVQLVRFPDDARLPIWIERVKGKGSTWTPDVSSRICTLHFETRYFFSNKRNNRLLNGAIPSLYLGNVPEPSEDSPPEFFYPSVSPTSSVSSSSCSTTNGSTKQCEVPQPQPKRIKVLLPKRRERNELDTGARKKIRVKPPPEKQSLPPQKQATPQAKDVSSLLDYLNVEEDDYLNKILLRRCIKGLITHVEELCKENQNPFRDPELDALNFMLHKIQRNMGLSADDALNLFKEQVPDNVYSLLSTLVKTTKRGYKALVRTFSLSLHFYSLPAYLYVREKMNGALPHPRTIQAWYTTIDKYTY